MITKDGNWTFCKYFDVIHRRLKNPIDRFIYSELMMRATRPGQKPLIQWQGSTVALQQGEVYLHLRPFAKALGFSSPARILRAFIRLRRERVLTVLAAARGRGGGMLIFVAGPDDVLDLNVQRAARLKQLKYSVSSQFGWDNDPNKKATWNNAEQSLKQLKKARDRLSEREDRTYREAKRTKSGTVDLLHRYNTPRELRREMLDALNEFDKNHPATGEEHING